RDADNAGFLVHPFKFRSRGAWRNVRPRRFLPFARIESFQVRRRRDGATLPLPPGREGLLALRLACGEGHEQPPKDDVNDDPGDYESYAKPHHAAHAHVPRLVVHVRIAKLAVRVMSFIHSRSPPRDTDHESARAASAGVAAKTRRAKRRPRRPGRQD